MKARIRKSKASTQPAETALRELRPMMRAIIGGASRKTWEGLFLKPEEEQHPHAVRLDSMSLKGLRSQASNLCRLYEKYVGQKGQEHYAESIRFELWLIAEVAQRKDLKL
jgi:hypothetical protein